ncbi:MAG: hypothetical protein JNM99_02890 [Verrucomicrobiaceae bacterium]|nr:hypothetical protein [Verrucomicrobiaceae bacterium]
MPRQTPVDVSPPSPSFSPSGRPAQNPFLEDVCTTPFDVVEERSVSGLNRDVVQRVAEAVEDLAAAPGKPLLLLTAPRAGYGKTHLLGRVAAAAGNQSVAMPLMFRSDVEVTWSGVSLEALETLRQMPGRVEDWPRLREICTGIFTSLIVRLIRSGRLPCANRDQAMKVLSEDPTALFREGSSAKLIGDWLRKHFGQLRKPLAELARQVPGAGVMDGWVDALFAASNHGTPPALDEVVKLASGSREAFALWLRLVALWHPAVLFVDHLDGFYRMEKSGLRIATMLLELAGMEGVHVVLSLNQDVWQATFAHHLPSALEDRLTASQFLLRGLTPADAAELARMRLAAAGTNVEERVRFERFLNIGRYFNGRPVGSVSARAFLRHLAQQWDFFQNLQARGEDPSASALIDPEPESVEPPSTQADPLPDVTLFGAEDAHFLRNAATALAEPTPAMVNTPFSVAPVQPSAPAPVLAEPLSPFVMAEPPAPIATNGTVPQAFAQPQAPNALEKLRDMMDRLRQQTTGAAPVVGAAAAMAAAGQAVARPPEPSLEPPPVSSAALSPQDALVARFEALRMQMLAEAESSPLDLAKVEHLIRLAGKRFPLVKYDEIELPGLPGKTAPRWSLQDQEIFFGTGAFNERSYWRALAQVIAGRMAVPLVPGRAPALKLVAFKSDRETMAWTALLGSDAFPSGIRQVIEALHLDTRSLAALYAMQRMIGEAEAGALNATPAQVMSVLARELDFFWKRVTRPVSQ